MKLEKSCTEGNNTDLQLPQESCQRPDLLSDIIDIMSFTNSDAYSAENVFSFLRILSFQCTWLLLLKVPRSLALREGRRQSHVGSEVTQRCKGGYIGMMGMLFSPSLFGLLIGMVIPMSIL